MWVSVGGWGTYSDYFHNLNTFHDLVFLYHFELFFCYSTLLLLHSCWFTILEFSIFPSQRLSLSFIFLFQHFPELFRVSSGISSVVTSLDLHSLTVLTKNLKNIKTLPTQIKLCRLSFYYCSS